MRRIVMGLALFAAAIAIAWALVAAAQAYGAGWVGALIGEQRLTTDAPLVETLFNLLLFGSMILLGIAGALIDRRNALALGRRPGRQVLLGLAIGLAGLGASIAYAKLAGTLTSGGAPRAAATLLAWGMAATFVQVLGEEVYFRGWLQPALTARWGWTAGIVMGAVAFSALHIAGGARDPISLVNLFLGGLMFGLLAARAGGIAAATAAHYGWNLTEYLAVGLDPNPGVGSFGTVWDLELVGAPIWGGSDQGLNGSVGMTVALLAIVVPLALLSWGRLPAAAPRCPAVPRLATT